MRPLTGKVACAKKLGSLNMSSSYTTKRRKANSGLLMSKTNCLKSQTGLKPLSAMGRGESGEDQSRARRMDIKGMAPARWWEMPVLFMKPSPITHMSKRTPKGMVRVVPVSPPVPGAGWECHLRGPSPTTSVLFLLLSYSEPHTSTSTKGHTMLLPFLGRCRAPRICGRKRRVRSGHARQGRTPQASPMAQLVWACQKLHGYN